MKSGHVRHHDDDFDTYLVGDHEYSAYSNELFYEFGNRPDYDKRAYEKHARFHDSYEYEPVQLPTNASIDNTESYDT